MLEVWIKIEKMKKYVAMQKNWFLRKQNGENILFC